jgi:hypothetical protein
MHGSLEFDCVNYSACSLCLFGGRNAYHDHLTPVSSKGIVMLMKKSA